MTGRAAIGDGRTVRRVMALLIGFAALAEAAACRSAPVRLFVIWLLRRGAALAEDYLLETGGVPAPAAACAPDGNDPADALILAARLRALAALLGALLPDASRLGRWPAPHPCATARAAHGLLGCGARGMRNPIDTS